MTTFHFSYGKGNVIAHRRAKRKRKIPVVSIIVTALVTGGQ